MGQFSWFTMDTHHRIVNGEEHTVYLVDDKGNKWKENCYEGYGVFGGKDFYELLAEMNGYSYKDYNDNSGEITCPIGLKRPVEHNKQPNRIIYFGTDGCVGHYPLGINFHLTRKDDKNFEKIDRNITDEFLNEATGTFFRYITNGIPYIGFGVPYSPDDERPGSKTIVLVENGTVQKVKDAILQNPFLLDKFKKVKEKYKLNIDFLEDIK